MVFPPCELRIWEVWNIAAAAAAAAATKRFSRVRLCMTP